MKRKSLVLVLLIAAFVLMLPINSFADILYYGEGNNYSEGNQKPDPNIDIFYGFSYNDLERINKGDLQVRVVMDVLDTDRGTFWNADYVEFILYDNFNNKLYSRFEENYDPHSSNDGYSAVWDTGKKDIVSGTSWLRLFFRIVADGDNDGGFNNIKLYFYDIGQPDVKEIKSDASGTKKHGDTVDIQVILDETVNVTGTPRIKLSTSREGVDRYANYSSGSGTNTLTFKYTVGEDDQVEALNYSTSLAKIDLNGGTIKDPAGNDAKQSFVGKTNNLINKNIKIDGKKPSISSITTSITNDKEDTYGPVKQLNQNDSVLMTVNFDEPVDVTGTAGNVKLILNNGSYAIAQNIGNDLTKLDFKYTVKSTDSDIAVLDITGIEGGTILDNAGNGLDRTIIKSISSDKIRIDNTPPAASFSENNNSTYMKQHDTVVTISDSESGLDGEIFKYYWSKDSNINNINWNIANQDACTGVNEVQNTIEISGVTGRYYLHVRSEDKAGNYGYNTSGAFYLDNQGPDISFSNTGSNNPRGDYNVSLSIADEHVTSLNTTSFEYQWYKNTINGNGWRSLSVVNGIGDISALGSGVNNDIDSHGKWKLAARGMDSLGNQSTAESGYFFIDKVAPDIEILPGSDISENHKKSHTITLSAEDPNYYISDYEDGTISGIWYQWKENEAEPAIGDGSWLPYSGAFSQGIFNGTKWLHVKAEDNSGNIALAKQAFMFDNEAPTITFVTNGSEIVQGDVTAEISLSDTFSGISEWYYQWSQDGVIDGGKWKPTASSQLHLSNVDGDWYLSVKAVDASGSESTATSNRFRLDNMPPTGGIDIVEEVTNINIIDVNLTAYDANYPDEIQYRISLDEGVSWSQWSTFASKIDNIAIPDIEGVRKVQVQYRDKFGNQSIEYEDTVVIDKVPPTAEIRYSESQWVAGDVTVVLGTIRDSYKDGETAVERDPFGVSLINSEETISYNGTSNEYTYIFKDNGRFDFRIKDKAGNETVVSALVNLIDKSKPSVTVEPNGQGVSSRTATAAIYAEDKVEFEGTVLKTEIPEIMHYQWSISTDLPDIDDGEWKETGNGDTVYISDVDGEWYLHVKVSDELGNTNIVRSNKFVLDNTPPNSTVHFDNTDRTANPVTAFIEFDEPTNITKPSDGRNSYTFEENGEFTFEYVDIPGNSGSKKVSVDWIDKSLPTVNISYSTKDWTNKSVTVTVAVYDEPKRELLNFSFPKGLDYYCVFSDVESDGTVVKAVYELGENGSFSFTVRDCETGVSTDVNAAVNNIDKVNPQGEAVFSETEKTRNDIVVTILTSDNTNREVEIIPPAEAIIVESGGNISYQFSKNGDYDFVLKDVSGNSVVLTVPINNIDREPPVGTVKYTPDKWTKGNVTAIVSTNEEAGIINNNGSAEYTFNENGSFTFWLRDTAGNTSEVTAEVNYIDRTPPQGVLKYNASVRTNKDVEVVVETSDNSNAEVQVINPGGTTVKEPNVSFMIPQNGVYEFKLIDAAGNEEILTATVNNIDKVLPEAEVSYSTTDSTNENVEIRLTLSEEAVVTVPDEIIVKEKNGNISYEVPENGDYIFSIRDLAQNENTIAISVKNIDRTPPVASVTYSTFDITKGPVIVEVTADEEFKVSNNFNSKVRVFNKNESYTFQIEDLAGNRSEVTAKVSNIDNEPPKVSIIYSTTEYTNSNVIATVASDESIVVLNNNGNRSFEFKENGTFRFKVSDLLGNETTVYANVSNIDKTPPVITFNSNNRPVFMVDGEYILDDFTAYDQIDGKKTDITEKVQVDKSGLNISREGQYKVIYSVTDRAGNTTVVNRDVIVVSPLSYRVFINGLDSQLDSMSFDTSQLKIDIKNQKGDVQIKWKKGYLNTGSMKSMANILEGNVFNAPSTGYYTFYIQDQERNAELIRVFIRSIDSKEVQ